MNDKIAMKDPGARRQYIPRGQMKHLSRESVLEELGPSKFAVLTLLLVLALLIGAVGWSYVVPITTSATTRGKVVPTGNQRMVQHLEGGIVNDIFVEDGDAVKAGQTLIRFDPTQRKADLDQIKARKAALSIREIRLRAQINGVEPEFGDLAVAYPTLVEEAKVTLLATRERISSARMVLESKIGQRQKSVAIFRKQMSSLKKQETLVREAVDMRVKLFEGGNGSRVNVITAQLELSRVQGALAEAETSADQAEVAIEEAQNELKELVVKERDDALQSLSDVLGELAEVTENLTRLQDRVNRLDVVAPVDGFVHGLTVNTKGAVVDPGALLMTLIPANERLIVETEIAPKDIGHVRIGQETKVVVSGFDQRRYGSVKGRLTRLSPTTLLNSDGVPYFKGQIQLDANHITANGTIYPIMPGMTVTADIVTGHQTLLQYLTGPVYNALSSSFTER